MFFIIIVLAAIGVASLLGSSVSASVGALVLLPILAFKLLLIAAFFGFFGRRWSRRWDGHWGHRPQRPASDEPTEADRFEELHRLAHAKEEVDSWAPES